MLRPTLWAPADIEIMRTVNLELSLHIFAAGAHHRIHTHDIGTVDRLLRLAPKPGPGASVGRVNFLNGSIAVPADPSMGAGLRYFSFTTEPLSPCTFKRDESLARDFEALTANLQLS
ncbi:MAG: hypothetical protein Q4P23_05910 [Micrococcaceae bacterium]|nr:hypothetical protein [Micrococcaceae bacterium]